MTMPKVNDMFRSFLEALEDGQPHSLKEISSYVADKYQMTSEERQQVISSGQLVLLNRVGWVKTYMKKAGLILTVKRGIYQINDEGKKALQENPKKITLDYLNNYESFREFMHPSHEETEGHADNTPENLTPQEQMDQNYASINQQLADELMSAIMDKDPWFFERLVVKLVKAMGYGNGLATEGIVTDKTGAGGIDGIITEDRLGFEKIYIQAKRFQPDTVIGRPVIQQFLGALMGKGANKGLFISTARYSKEAIEFVENHLTAKIVLIDGEKLTKLMIEYNLGVAPTNSYTIKAIDNDFFTDEDE